MQFDGPWFVYRLEGRHVWRFVFFAQDAGDGDDAILQAMDEARAMENEPLEEPGKPYMAVPVEAITTLDPATGARLAGDDLDP